ncbi:MAG: TVP38/TMEM64 family protein [Stenomitos rutilans HA7619-LM2]|jgi:uncharacterized membrane protein YdjX (TVP38/TMEM64 family)|nr:TVP38/TMEM64 family protein [Stenomitos rutilans HA7619-LM2]
MPTTPYKTALWIALAVFVLVVVCLYTPVNLLFNQAFLVMELDDLGDYAALIFVLSFTIATTFGFPGNVATVAGGAVFGLYWGTLWSLLGATLGAVGAFLLARYFLHGWATQRFGQQALLQRINRAIEHKPMNFLLAVRFTPLSPFSLVNFLFGLTPIDLKTYTIGTFVGIIPLTIAYTWLGVTGKQAFSGGDHLPFFFALGVLTLLSVMPLLIKQKPIPQQPKSLFRRKQRLLK